MERSRPQQRRVTFRITGRSAPVPRDGAPHYPHALNRSARSRSAPPNHDIATPSTTTLSARPSTPSRRDASLSGRARLRAARGAPGRGRPPRGVGGHARPCPSCLSHFPQTTTPVVCAVSVRRPRAPDHSLESEDVGQAVRHCARAVRRTSDRARGAHDHPGQRRRRRQGGQLSTGVMGQYRTGVDSRLRVSGEALAESC